MSDELGRLRAAVEIYRERIALLERDKQDLEIAYVTAVEHGDAAEAELADMVARLRGEVKERMLAETRLERLVKAIRRQNEDLELLVRTIAEHSDEIDIQWLARYAEAEEQARLDPLTRIANRRGFDAAMESEWRRSARTRSDVPLSVVICDVDQFKSYNDRYGQAAGDRCLTDIAGLVRQLCRLPGEVAARYGGDEFALLLPGRSAADAYQIAGALLAQVQAAALPDVQGTDGILTVSIGVASVVPDDSGGPWDLLTEADRQLYAAKKFGRNRVRMAKQEAE